MKEGQETEADKQVGCHADVCGGCEIATLPLISPSPRQHQASYNITTYTDNGGAMRPPAGGETNKQTMKYALSIKTQK